MVVCIYKGTKYQKWLCNRYAPWTVVETTGETEVDDEEEDDDDEEESEEDEEEELQEVDVNNAEQDKEEEQNTLNKEQEDLGSDNEHAVSEKQANYSLGESSKEPVLFTKRTTNKQKSFRKKI